MNGEVLEGKVKGFPGINFDPDLNFSNFLMCYPGLGGGIGRKFPHRRQCPALMALFSQSIYLSHKVRFFLKGKKTCKN